MSKFIDLGAATVGCNPRMLDIVRVNNQPDVGQYTFDSRTGDYEINCPQSAYAERALTRPDGTIGEIETLYFPF